MTFITLGFKNNVITDGTFITLGSKCLLQMGPLLQLGPVITLVPSTGPGKHGSPLRWSNPPVYIISHFNLITFTSSVG